MSRITLDTDNLQVETFETAPVNDPGAVGVAGYTDSCAPDQFSRCGPNICDPLLTPSVGPDCA